MKALLLLLVVCWSSLALAVGGPGVSPSLQGKCALMPGLSMLQPTVPHSTFRITNTQGYNPWVEQVTGLPVGHTVMALHAVDSNTVWAVSSSSSGLSRVYTRTTNGGATWICDTIHTAPATYGIAGLYAFDGSTAWVVMYDGSGAMTGGGIFSTTDGGATWRRDPTAFGTANPGTADFIHFFDANNGVCVGDPTNGYLEIYTTSNGGASWSRVPQANIPAQPGGWEGAYWSEYSAAGNSLWFPGTTLGSGRIYKTTDKGLTWSLVLYPKMKADWFPAIEFQDENVGLGNGDFGEFMKTTDGGVTWTMLPLQDGLAVGHLEYVPHTSGMFVATTFLACNALFGGYLYGTAYTTDGGANWTMATSSGAETYPNLNFSSPSSGWCAESGPNIYKWTMAQGRVIGVSVDTLNFSMLETGQPSDTIAVGAVNFGSDPITVSGIVAPGANFMVIKQPVYPAILPPLGLARFEVSFTPKARGVKTDSLVVLSNATNDSHVGIVFKGESWAITTAQPSVMYGASGLLDSGRLLSIDPYTGAATAIGPSGFAQIASARVHPRTHEILSLIPSGVTSVLARTNSVGGDAHALSTIPISLLKGMDFRGDTLYVGRFTGEIYRVNVNTGDTALVAKTSPTVNIAGLAFHPKTGKLWASVRSGSPVDRIFKISLPSGAATLVGSTGLGQISDIIFDGNGRLFGISGTGSTNNSLVRIDTTTGIGTVIGSMGRASVQALAVDPNFLVGVPEPSSKGVPATYALEQNYPNPFNPKTVIRYDIAGVMDQGSGVSDVNLVVYDLLGREVAVLVNERQAPRSYSVTFDANGLSSGIYFYRMSTGNFVQTKKLVVLR